VSGPSLRSAIDAKCRECGGADGGARFWRVHVSVCPVTECPLWPVRPLARRNVPYWLASRNVADLPADFLWLTTEAAIALIRGADAVMDAETATNSLSGTIEASEHGEGA
jgi:hypothetical protein